MRVSRMLQDPGRVKPMQWRQGPAASRTASGSPDGSATSPEVLLLQEQLEQLRAASDVQAREAYESGFSAGDAAGRAATEGDVHSVVARYTAAIADLSAMRAETIRRAETDTVRLAVEIARRILHRELTMNTSALEALIRAALEKLQTQEVYRVRIHPDMEKVVRDCLQEAGRDAAVEVIKDPIQPKGGAVFEIGRGALDASMDTQLSEIERCLTECLEERP